MSGRNVALNVVRMFCSGVTVVLPSSSDGVVTSEVSMMKCACAGVMMALGIMIVQAGTEGTMMFTLDKAKLERLRAGEDPFVLAAAPTATATTSAKPKRSETKQQQETKQQETKQETKQIQEGKQKNHQRVRKTVETLQKEVEVEVIKMLQKLQSPLSFDRMLEKAAEHLENPSTAASSKQPRLPNGRFASPEMNGGEQSDEDVESKSDDDKTALKRAQAKRRAAAMKRSKSSSTLAQKEEVLPVLPFGRVPLSQRIQREREKSTLRSSKEGEDDDDSDENQDNDAEQNATSRKRELAQSQDAVSPVDSSNAPPKKKFAEYL